MIKSYFKEYSCLSKSGLLRNGQYVLIGIIILMFLVGKYLGATLESLIFILSSIGYMSDFDSNKYVINYCLPISTKRRLHILYYNTIFASFLSTAMVSLRCFLDGQNRGLSVSLFIFFIEVMGCNLHYYLFASPEFKKNIVDDNKGQFIYQCTIGALIGIVISIRLKQIEQGFIERMFHNLDTMSVCLLIVFMGSFTVWWTRYSMRKFEKVIRDERRWEN